jgi:hypothetical protein
MTPQRGAGPIDDYLDELFLASSGDPRAIRYQLAEAEAHLRDAAAEASVRGLAEIEAEREAVARFGAAPELARAERARQALAVRELVQRSVLSALWLVGIGGLAVGASAAVTGLLDLVFGGRFIVGDPPASVLTPTNCARWLEGASVHSCAQAAVIDWTGDVVLVRSAFGALGAVALGTWLLLGRRVPGRRMANGLPLVVVDSVAVTSFGAAGVLMAALGVDALVGRSGLGAGQWFAAAPVALVVAVVFALRLLRTLRRPAADWNAPRAAPETTA